MPKSRKVWLAASLAAIGFLFYLGYQAYDLMRPLEPEPPLTFIRPRASTKELIGFLASDFVVLRRMRSLPLPVQGAFTETGGRRFTMTNPGDNFEATDNMILPGLPRKRLIFAGVYGDKCFVHFEAGGIVHSYEVALLKLLPSDRMEAGWHGYCGPAKDLPDLRNQIESGDCQSE